jgi:hypothetical protein
MSRILEAVRTEPSTGSPMTADHQDRRRRPGQGFKLTCELVRVTRWWQPAGVHSYGQYCPIARASELLAERWSISVLRNILIGCRTFNGIAKGAPRLSRGLLSKRLRDLADAGVVEIRPNQTAWARPLPESRPPPATPGAASSIL